MNFGGSSIGIFAWRQLPTIDLRAINFSRPEPVKGLMLADPSASCEYSSHGTIDGFGFDGDPIDVNGNGIPDDFYIKIVCVQSDSVATDTVVTETLTEEIALKEIAGSLFGMTVREFIQQEARDNHGRYQFVRYNVSGLQDIRADGITDKASLKFRQETNLDGDVVFEQAEQSFNNAFDPDGTITLGNDLPDGALTIAGNQALADSDGNNLAFGISTTTALAYSAACAGSTNPPFTAGVLHGKLNSSSSQASFDITFTGCGTYTVDVNGAYDEPVVVSARP